MGPLAMIANAVPCHPLYARNGTCRATIIINRLTTGPSMPVSGICVYVSLAVCVLVGVPTAATGGSTSMKGEQRPWWLRAAWMCLWAGGTSHDAAGCEGFGGGVIPAIASDFHRLRLGWTGC